MCNQMYDEEIKNEKINSCRMCDEVQVKLPYIYCYNCNKKRKESLIKCSLCDNLVNNKFKICYKCNKNKPKIVMTTNDTPINYDNHDFGKRKLHG